MSVLCIYMCYMYVMYIYMLCVYVDYKQYVIVAKICDM